MLNKKFILIGLDDEQSKKIAEILGNKTCKKIIDCLSEKDEASEKDISDALRIKLNTVEYNLKKLLNAGLLEKTKNFFWSKKGRKIPLYKLSNKSIIISPKGRISSQIKTILPVAIISGIAALIIRQLYISRVKDQTQELVVRSTQIFSENQAIASTNIWIWFLFGSLFAIIIFMIINLRIWKVERRQKKNE